MKKTLDNKEWDGSEPTVIGSRAKSAGDGVLPPKTTKRRWQSAVGKSIGLTDRINPRYK